MQESQEHIPKVTVYLVTKNRVSLLKRALKSIEDQTFRNLEIIVVDDGSDDETQEFMQGYVSVLPLRYERFETSNGAPFARNHAISLARGEFITGLDDDDRFLPKRVERFVSSWQEGISLLGAESFLVTDTRKLRWRKPSVITFNDLLYRNLVGNQIFTRTAYLRKLGGFDVNLEASQDYDMWLRLVRKFGPARILNEPLQLVTMKSRDDRITTNLDSNWGYYVCYRKHRRHMSIAQRRYHVYNIRVSRGKSYTLCNRLASTPLRFWVKELAKWAFQ